jgi:hypothetical protein
LQDKDVEGKIAGVQGHYTHQELYDDGQVWGKPKQRSNEYDAIYLRLSQHAVDLRNERGRPCTVVQAAEDLGNKEKICKKKSEGGKSMYKFMKECEDFRAEQAKLRKQARAAQLAQQQQEEEQQDEDGDG